MTTSCAGLTRHSPGQDGGRAFGENLRNTIEVDGDSVTDLHLWRVGPGHLGAIVSVATAKDRASGYYHRKLAKFADLSHVTVEVQPLSS